MFAKKSISRICSVLFVLAFLLALVGPASTAPAALAGPAKTSGAPSLLQFTAGGHALGFSAGGMYAATGTHALHVDFAGANAVQPQADSPASPSTLLRTSPDGKAASLSQVSYPDLWDGISLTYTAEAGSLYTTTYTLRPGAAPANIRLRYNAPLTLNKNGSLGVAFETGSLTESAPLAWQDIDGRRVPVDTAFSVNAQEVSFAVGAHNPRYPLTIDPSVTWNTFLGGSAIEDDGLGIAPDGRSVHAGPGP